MSGNTIGRLFQVTTFGESHGPAIGCIVDGCPPGLELSEDDFKQDIDRRRTGTSHFVSQRKEADAVRILSGVFEGRTTGSSIGLLIENTDARSRDYDKIKDRFRPGHADYTYQQKYGFRDYRGGGRSSARETVVRVAAGAIAKKYLAKRLGVEIYGYLSQIGDRVLEPVAPHTAYDNPFFCPDPSRVKELEDLIWKIREEGDSIGAKVTVVARGVPPGLGEPVFDRLDADIAYAMMGINAVKAVEIGGPAEELYVQAAGFRSAFTEAMDQDFNTAKAVSLLLELVRTINRVSANKQIAKRGASLMEMALEAFEVSEAVLGLGGSAPQDFFDEFRDKRSKALGIDASWDEVATRLAARLAALLHPRA